MTGSNIPRSCDVVVIGAGVGGLAAAALLARSGVEVCLVEAEARVGGYIAGFSRGGFSFDTAIHWLNQCGPGGVVRKILDHLGPDAPRTPPKERIRRYLHDGSDYLLTNDPDRLRDALVADFPEDRRGIVSFFESARTLGRSFSRFSDHMRAIETRNLWDRLRCFAGMTRAGWPFARFAGLPADEGLARFFRGPIRDRMWPSEASLIACLMPVAWAYSGDYQRPPEGGSRRIAEWLTAICERAGAVLACRCRATGIVAKDGRAAAVRIAMGASGEDTAEIRCRNVIAACDAETVYRSLLPRTRPVRRYLERLEAADLYDSALSVFLGLSAPADSLGLGEELVHIANGGPQRIDRDSDSPENSEVTVLAPSAVDPTLAPAGKGTIVLYTPAKLESFERWRTGPALERGAEYRDLKRRLAEMLIERTERALRVDLKSRIEVIEVATPVTYLRYTGNRGGAIMGLRASRRNLRARLAGYSTPVGGVLLGGQWAEYGGGLPAAVRAGANAAAIVLRSEKPSAFAALRDVMDGRMPR